MKDKSVNGKINKLLVACYSFEFGKNSKVQVPLFTVLALLFLLN
jgi:hypothetical protein